MRGLIAWWKGEGVDRVRKLERRWVTVLFLDRFSVRESSETTIKPGCVAIIIGLSDWHDIRTNGVEA